MNSNVLSRSAFASVLLGGAQLIARSIDFVLILILARILTPEDFALIAIAAIFVSITEIISQVSIGQVLITANRVSRDMLYTSFTIALIRAALVVSVILLLTPLAVVIFSEFKLYTLMPVLALGPALRGLRNPKMIFFARHMNFIPDATIELISKFLMALIALPIAISIQSYWALVLISILTPLFVVIGTYLYIPFRPKFSVKSWPMFANMIGWTTVSQFFMAAYLQTGVFIVALFSSRNVTGNYSVANTLTSITQQVFIFPAIRPFTASFSILRRSGDLYDAYLTTTKAMLMIIGPILVGIALLSEPIVLLLFGSEWAFADLFLSVLSVCTLISVVGLPAPAVAFAFDRTVFIAISSAVAFISLSIFCVAGYLLFELPGFLTGMIAGAVARCLAEVWAVKSILKLSALTQIRVLGEVVFALSIMAAIVFQAKQYASFETTKGILISLPIIATLGAIVYSGSILFLWWIRGCPNGLESKILLFAVSKLRTPQVPEKSIE